VVPNGTGPTWARPQVSRQTPEGAAGQPRHHRLQGRDDLAPYYSEEIVSGHEDLAWGPVTGE
jgi:hypothetical protein